MGRFKNVSCLTVHTQPTWQWTGCCTGIGTTPHHWIIEGNYRPNRREYRACGWWCAEPKSITASASQKRRHLPDVLVEKMDIFKEHKELISWHPAVIWMDIDEHSIIGMFMKAFLWTNVLTQVKRESLMMNEREWCGHTRYDDAFHCHEASHILHDFRFRKAWAPNTHWVNTATFHDQR